MRKIFLLLMVSCTTMAVHAQFNTVQFSPATFTGDDSVTFTIDLTGTPMDGKGPAYVWIWCNGSSTSSQYPNTNGVISTTWTNSPPRAQMKSLGGNLYQFGFVGSTMFNLQPSQLQYFQFICKTQTGSSQTSNSPQYNFAPVAYIPSIYRLFPSKISASDPVTIYFYQNLATDLTESRMTPVSVTLTATDTLGNSYGSPVTLPLKSLGQQLFSAAFVPSVIWHVPNPALLKQFTYVINGTSYDNSGNPTTVTGSTNTRVFDILQ